MKIQPTVPRNKPLGADAKGVRVRYDPKEHKDGVPVPDDVGEALVKTGHWVEVKPKLKKMSTIVDKAPESVPHDSLQS